MNDERMSTASVELALRDLVDHPTGVLTAVGQECVMRDLLDARAQEESWKILANKANERADYFERERDEARPVLEAAREQARIGATLGPPLEEYYASCKVTNERIRIHDAARAAGGGGDEPVSS